ncbi:MAG: aldo/keto reductase [Ilumatobacteraceae bacterium]
MTLVRTTARRLGSLPPVGPLAYGLWRFTNDDVAVGQRLIETALDAGMNLVDTADVYGYDWGGTGFGQVEEILGRVLAASPSLRDRMVLATKGGIAPPTPYDSSADYLRSACEASLRRLGVEVIDLYQIHRPDLFSHPADVAAVLAELRDAGKIREVGVSNHTVAQVEALSAHLPFPIVTTQPEYSAIELGPLRDGTLDHCLRTGVVPLAWSPLAGGALATGQGIAPDLLDAIDAIADREHVDRSAVAIIGSQNPQRIAGAAAALGVQLDRHDVYQIIQASEGVPLP